MRLPLLALVLSTRLHAQWDLQPSHTTESLRGIHALGGGVAWASGTEGTVLRTTDDGLSWQRCPTPPAAEHLDFRGIQAFDASTALVMSSGKGDLSRLYKTTDSCQSWKLVFTNPDPDGFWDAIHFDAPTRDLLGQPFDFSRAVGDVLGDPVNGQFAMFWSANGGDDWARRSTGKERRSGCKVDPVNATVGESAFAASNEALLTFGAGSGFSLLPEAQPRVSTFPPYFQWTARSATYLCIRLSCRLLTKDLPQVRSPSRLHLETRL